MVFHVAEHRPPSIRRKLRRVGLPEKALGYTMEVTDRSRPCLTRSDSSPPESAVGTTPALPPGGGRRMSGCILSALIPRSSPWFGPPGRGLSYFLHVTLGNRRAALRKSPV
ncbi:hypothetical protein GCM10010219_56300 [Streptomyces netropsis]|nr:hypothetical protein GCM10010219_56300 [Streptomyces netropsis]